MVSSGRPRGPGRDHGIRLATIRRSASSRWIGRGHARGQALPFFILVLPGLLVVLGLGIDAANLYLERRAAQMAADLAALAGARHLPAHPPQAVVMARDVAAINGWGTTVAVNTPFETDPRRIEVVVRRDVPTFLLGLIDIDQVAVSARAVARNDPQTSGGYAVFAGRSNCGSGSELTLDWSGSSIGVTGQVHSNDGAKFGGGGNSIAGATTYSCANRFENGDSSNRFTPAPARVDVRPWPVTFVPSQFACDWPSRGVAYDGNWDLNVDGPWWVNGRKSSKQLQPGVYCATGSSGGIKLSDSDIRGNVTFVATQTIDISGSNFDLTPYANGVLFYSQGTSDVALKVAGSGGRWQGIMYAPNGQVEISGSGNMTISGGIVAQTVKLGGSSFNITGTAGQVTTASLQLVD